MRIKHSKYKNTGLLFELLIKQITSDTLEQRNSPALKILKTFYSGKSALAREFKLYELITKGGKTSQNRAESVISTIIEVSSKIDKDVLKKQKYSLIKEIKEHYELEEFFTIKVGNYKPLAAMYCLLEAHKNTEIVDPSFLVDNKTTLLEYLTERKQDKEEVKETLIEEYSKYDKDLKILAFKILLEKFNNKYDDLLPQQKRVLREYINSVDSSSKLRKLFNRELAEIQEAVVKARNTIEDNVLVIKLDEVLKHMEEIPKTQKVSDGHLADILQYYELVKEIERV